MTDSLTNYCWSLPAVSPEDYERLKQHTQKPVPGWFEELFPDEDPDFGWVYLSPDDNMIAGPGNVQHAATLIQQWLQQIKSDAVIIGHYSHIPSRPIANGYGGGVVGINRHSVIFIDTEDVVKMLDLETILGKETRKSADAQNWIGNIHLAHD